MNHVLLNATYDAGNQIGPILAYIFFFLLLIGVIYAMAKYLGSSNK